ncbi:MAG TPA: hypothetical protein VFQ25_05005 [Ktedonobacterales bacterium]|nr:hypothetical protein [Ktedonobacterales bacterium]
MTTTSTSTPEPTPTSRRRLPRSVSATLAIWSALLRLCPRAFRQSHAVEMEQVFRAMLLDAWHERGARGVARLWAPALGDLLIGAAAAHGDDLGLSLEALKWSWLMSRMRSSAITIFSAYIALVLAGVGFQKLTEDIMKTTLPNAYPGIALAHDAIVVGAIIALLAVLVGGLPIAWDAISQALSARRWGIVALLAVPPISLAIWLGYIWAALNVFVPNGLSESARVAQAHLLGRILVALFLLAATASVIAVSVAVSRSQITAERYRFALRAAIAATLGMFITMAGVAAFSLQVLAAAPQDLSALATPLGFGESTGLSLLIQTIVMLLASIAAALSVFRGLSAPPAQPDGAAALA